MWQGMFTTSFLGLALFLAGAEEKLPRGLPATHGASASPLLVELGAKLFREKRLSADCSIACASCHDPEKHFASSDARALGIKKQAGRRNAPSLLNRVYGEAFFWDGRARTRQCTHFRFHFSDNRQPTKLSWARLTDASEAIAVR